MQGSLLNFLLLLFKFIAGILGHSSALVADAFHSLSDFASDLIILVCIRLSSKPEDEDHSYGHGKYETLASVAIGLILLGTGIGLFWDGTSKIIDLTQGKKLQRPEMLALYAALISILVKEGLYHYTMWAAKKTDSDTLKTNAWHHRSDSLSSIATLIGIGCAMIPGGKWAVADPLAACMISLFIIFMSFSLMKPGLEELLEKALPEAEKKVIEEIILTTPGVLGFHHLRTRRMGINRAVEAHIKLNGDLSLYKAHATASLIEKKIKNKLGENTHVGIHMEPAYKAIKPSGTSYKT